MLDPEQKQRLHDLFAEGIELPVEQRAAFVERHCGADPMLRGELAELLDIADGRLQSFLAKPIAASPPVTPTSFPGSGTLHPTLDVALPELADYEILEPIAAGGMGIVYRARQLRPIRRIVAIKSIRVGMDSAQLLARFDAEREALARMSHPYIATVHDAGTDSAGRPYLAMEFVEGEAITDYCERRALPLEQRLDLFVRVCEAVEHAHRRGVLHRDLKPSNILVTTHGDQPIPKVIDFGIAKALDAPLADAPLGTGALGLLGTPEYMSPEQFDRAASELDTRSDVYSLGVLFYELLAGAPPFDATRLRQAGLAGIGTILRDEVPPKPSTRLRQRTTYADGEAPAATGRDSWRQRLPTDLDWIAMRALEKDPERRYGSPREFASDVANHLRHLPVVAGPPGSVYRLRKFVRRYRLQVIAALLLLVSLAVGLTGTTYYLFEARANADTASRSAAEAWTAQRRAEGIRIATDAAMLADSSPNVALLLAVEASRLTDEHAVNRTIHQILPNLRLQASIEAHDHGIREFAFLPDGRLLAQPHDSVTLLLDPDDGSVLHRYTGHTDTILDLDLLPSADRFLTTAHDGTARLWEVETGACVLEVGRPGVAALQGAVDPTGTRLAIAYADGTVELHRSSGDDAPYRFVTGGSDGALAAFEASGRYVVTSAQTAGIRWWSVEDGTLVGEVSREQLGLRAEEQILQVDPSAEARRFVVQTEERGRYVGLLLATASGEVLLRYPGRPVASQRTGNSLRAVGIDEHVVLDLEHGGFLERHSTEGMPGVIGIAPDGTWAVGADQQRDLCLVEFPAQPGATPRVEKLLGESEKRWDLRVAFHPDGQRFATGRDQPRIWRRSPLWAGVQLPRQRADFELVSVAFGDRFWALLRARDAEPARWELWDASKGILRSTLSPEGVTGLMLAPDGSRLVGTTFDPVKFDFTAPAAIASLDLDGERLHDDLPVIAPLDLIRPDGGAILGIRDPHTGDLTTSVVDVRGGRAPVTFQRPRGQALWFLTSIGPRLVFRDGTADLTHVFRADEGTQLGRAHGPEGASHYGPSISPDGRYLVVVLGDLRARTYDLSRAEPDGTFPMVAEYPSLVRSNNYFGGFLDGSRLTWVRCSNEVHVFETATGEPFTVLSLTGDCAGLVEDPERREFLTITDKFRIQRWPLDPVRVAEELAVGRLTRRQLERFEIGTPQERQAAELDALRAVARMRNFARLGELARAAGDLDAAIAAYQQGLAMRRLAPQDRRRYRQTLELLCERLGDPQRAAEQHAADLDAAFEVLGELVRCGASAEECAALPGIDVLVRDPRYPGIVNR